MKKKILAKNCKTQRFGHPQRIQDTASHNFTMDRANFRKKKCARMRKKKEAPTHNITWPIATILEKELKKTAKKLQNGSNWPRIRDSLKHKITWPIAFTLEKE